MRLVLTAAFAALAVAAPARAAAPDVVEIRENPPVNCVTFPCWEAVRPTHVVCLLPDGANICTPADL